MTTPTLDTFEAVRRIDHEKLRLQIAQDLIDALKRTLSTWEGTWPEPVQVDYTYEPVFPDGAVDWWLTVTVAGYTRRVCLDASIVNSLHASLDSTAHEVLTELWDRLHPADDYAYEDPDVFVHDR